MYNFTFRTINATIVGVNYNCEFSLYKKDDKVAIAARNDSTIGIDFEKQNVLVENYERVFGISISNLIRDASFIIIELLVLVFILYNAFQQRRSIFQTVKDMLSFFNNCQCNKRILLPTIRHPSPTAVPLPTERTAARPTAPPYAQPSNISCYPQLYPDSRVSMVDPNLYQTIGNPFQSSSSNGHISRSTSLTYQPRMQTRSASQSSVNENVYVKADVRCPHCIKSFKNKRALAGHMVVHL